MLYNYIIVCKICIRKYMPIKVPLAVIVSFKIKTLFDIFFKICGVIDFFIFMAIFMFIDFCIKKY